MQFHLSGVPIYSHLLGIFFSASCLIHRNISVSPSGKDFRAPWNCEPIVEVSSYCRYTWIFPPSRKPLSPSVTWLWDTRSLSPEVSCLTCPYSYAMWEKLRSFLFDPQTYLIWLLVKILLDVTQMSFEDVLSDGECINIPWKDFWKLPTILLDSLLFLHVCMYVSCTCSSSC